MIETMELSKRFEDHTLALERLDLRVEPGQVYCLLGANGAGKTTTMNLLLNFVEPSSGRALIDGVDVSRDPLESRRRCAYLSENVRLYGSFTARENLEFFAKLSGRKLKRAQYYAVLERIGLPEPAFEKQMRRFSKGMRQKVAIAIAMVKDAPALLLDEPLSGLDPTAAAELVDILRRLRREGKAILMSTHDIFRAKEIADHVGILKEGRKVASLSRDELRDKDLEALYLEYMRATAPSP